MVRAKNIALTYALMPSLYCEAEFCIKCLNTVIYILFIGYSVCGKKDQVIFKKDDELFLKGRRLF